MKDTQIIIASLGFPSNHPRCRPKSYLLGSAFHYVGPGTKRTPGLDLDGLSGLLAAEHRGVREHRVLGQVVDHISDLDKGTPLIELHLYIFVLHLLRRGRGALGQRRGEPAKGDGTAELSICYFQKSPNFLLTTPARGGRALQLSSHGFP